MNNKKIFLALLLVFVLLIIGAYVLYNRLGETVLPDQMLISATTQPTAEPTATPSATQDTAPADEADDNTADVLLAPDFIVYDLDGNPVQLSDFFGKPIVLNFWASWCGPCQSEMPAFNQKWLELEGNVHFLMINMTDGSRETVQTASAFIARQGYSFPVYYDKTYQAATAYGAYSLPTSYFINAQGHVIARAVGAIGAATLQRGIDMITE